MTVKTVLRVKSNIAYGKVTRWLSNSHPIILNHITIILFDIPCFITCAPGTYRLKMLLKEEGSNIWILPSDRYSEERDWMFTVQADNGTPSIKFMNPEGYRVIKNEILKFKL